MPIGIVEVLNNTGYKLHYENQESGYKFDINPKTQDYENNGWIPTSGYHDDTVPYKSSGRSIIVNLDNGHQVAITDDYYKFRIIGNSRPEQWTGSFSNGDRFVLKVDDQNGVSYTFVKYEDDLHTTEGGWVLSSLIQAAAKIVGVFGGY